MRAGLAKMNRAKRRPRCTWPARRAVASRAAASSICFLSIASPVRPLLAPLALVAGQGRLVRRIGAEEGCAALDLGEEKILETLLLEGGFGDLAGEMGREDDDPVAID